MIMGKSVFINALLLAAGLDIVAKRKQTNKMSMKMVLACSSFRFKIVV